MSIEEKILERFGRDIAQDIGTGSLPQSLQSQEQVFMGLVLASVPHHRPFGFVPALVGIAAMLCAGIAAALFWMTPDPLSFSIGSQKSAASDNVWIQASVTKPLPMYFEDGTELKLKEETAIRVVKSNVKEVNIDVSRGKVKAAVGGKNKTRWTVDAGPYRLVTFAAVYVVSWESKAQVLNIEVQKGEVLVEGNGLATPGIKLGAGDTLNADAKHKQLAWAQASASAPKKPENPSSATAPRDPLEDKLFQLPVEPRQFGKQKNHHRRAANDASESGDWKSLYDQDDYRAAIAKAQEQGIDKLISSSAEADLWKLADAARNAGQADLCEKILLAFRQQFRNSTKARIATFLLGRIAFEQHRDYDRAVKWFNTYLREAPTGTLAEEALGRLFVAYTKAGQGEQAYRAATEYLNAYPHGPFAKLAAQLTGN